MQFRHFLAITLAALAMTGAGCVTVNSSGTAQGADGGVWKSANQGDAWAQSVAVPTTSGQKASIAGVNVAVIVQDPSDAKALYLGTAENGLFYSYDGGASWLQPAQLNRGRVPSVAVDPSDKCRVFAAVENKLVVTEDCSRTWKSVYQDARTDRMTTAVAVDFFSPNTIWIANDGGDVLKSADGGASWASVGSFKSPVVKLAMSPSDSRRLYVATKSAGVWRTEDGGEKFVNLADKYKDINNTRELYDIAVSASDPKAIVLAVKQGLIRSMDGGDKWEDLRLLTPPGTTVISAVALDPKDVGTLYYGTSTTFYRTTNAGANWVTKKLPTSRAATFLLVDRETPATLYMGVTKLK